MAGKGRSSGEGTVRKHARGNHEARLYVPVKLRHLYDGQRTVSFYGKTEALAIQKRDAANRELDERRGVRAGDLTVGVYFARWLDSLEALKTVSERTLQDYRYHAEKHLIPPDKLGTVLFEDLTAEDLDLLYARLAKGGMGARGVNHVHSTARVALQRAVKKRLIPYNPARDADPPRYSTDEREYATLTREGVGAFFEAARGDRFEALFWVAILAGPRPAELRALKWEDLSLPESGAAGALIRRTVVELKGEPPKIRNTTKTRRPRSVPLLADVVATLRVHRVRQNEERLALAGLWQDNDLLCSPRAPGASWAGRTSPTATSSRSWRRQGCQERRASMTSAIPSLPSGPSRARMASSCQGFWGTLVTRRPPTATCTLPTGRRARRWGASGQASGHPPENPWWCFVW